MINSPIPELYINLTVHLVRHIGWYEFVHYRINGKHKYINVYGHRFMEQAAPVRRMYAAVHIEKPFEPQYYILSTKISLFTNPHPAPPPNPPTNTHNLKVSMEFLWRILYYMSRQ